MGATSVVVHRVLQLLEILLRKSVRWIDLKRAFELCLSFGESPQFCERAAQVCMRVGVFWP